MKLLLRYRLTSGLFIVLSIAYLATSILTDPDKATLTKYSITASQLVWLSLTISLPYVVIWFMALVGYLRFKSYADTIKDSKDGSAFSTIARGLLCLSVWLPISAVLQAASTHLYRPHPSYTPTLIILINYANLLILFPAFFTINKGARKLLTVARTTVNAVSQKTIILYIAFSALYVMLTLEDSARYAPTHSTMVASYYLPDWLIVMTIVIPRLIMWFLGIQAVQYIYHYQNKVKGKLYRVALIGVARGIAGVVFASIFLRCIQSLSSPLGNLSLALVLLIVYVLLIALGIGYLSVARGAKKLQMIEDI